MQYCPAPPQQSQPPPSPYPAVTPIHHIHSSLMQLTPSHAHYSTLPRANAFYTPFLSRFLNPVFSASGPPASGLNVKSDLPSPSHRPNSVISASTTDNKYSGALSSANGDSTALCCSEWTTAARRPGPGRRHSVFAAQPLQGWCRPPTARSTTSGSARTSEQITDPFTPHLHPSLVQDRRMSSRRPPPRNILMSAHRVLSKRRPHHSVQFSMDQPLLGQPPPQPRTPPSQPPRSHPAAAAAALHRSAPHRGG